jgi:hypothetical protein
MKRHIPCGSKVQTFELNLEFGTVVSKDTALPGFGSQHWQDFFFVVSFMSVLGPTQPPILWELNAFYWKVKTVGVNRRRRTSTQC